VKEAIEALERIGGEAISGLQQTVHHTNSTTRVRAVRALARIAEREDAAIPILVNCLLEKDPWVRLEAILGLHDIGPRGVLAASSLKQRLKDSHNLLRLGANLALAAIDPVYEIRLDRQVADLVTAVNSWDIRVVDGACRILDRMGAAARPAFDALIILLSRQWDPPARLIELLAKLAEHDPTLVVRLADLAGNSRSRPELRQRAAEALLVAANSFNVPVPNLVQLCQTVQWSEKNPELLKLAKKVLPSTEGVMVLAKFVTSPKYPFECQDIFDGDVFARWQAAEALASVPSDQFDLAVPALVAALADPVKIVRDVAAQSLKRLVPERAVVMSPRSEHHFRKCPIKHICVGSRSAGQGDRRACRIAAAAMAAGVSLEVALEVSGKCAYRGNRGFAALLGDLAGASVRNVWTWSFPPWSQTLAALVTQADQSDRIMVVDLRASFTSDSALTATVWNRVVHDPSLGQAFEVNSYPYRDWIVTSRFELES
jgi:HEAT repeat protein